LAIDFCEDVPALPDAAIDRIVALMEQAGMSAKVSSIHVNGWFGSYDKLSMAQLMLRERYQLELAQERDRCIFVGDSPNDAPMFAYLPHAVGVANVRELADRMSALPAWVTPSRGGAGFAELAEALVAARPNA
jgi:hydroxymethylpyrimidine pyrophosphatase-like HAD family hydrolase